MKLSKIANIGPSCHEGLNSAVSFENSHVEVLQYDRIRRIEIVFAALHELLQELPIELLKFTTHSRECYRSNKRFT